MPVPDSELLDRFLGIVIDHDTKELYLGWLDHQLRLPHCAACGNWIAQQRPICPRCWSFDVHPESVSGRGKVHLLIWLHQGPPAPGVDYSTPYPVATIELEEQPGLRYTSTILDVEQADIVIGDLVTLDWIERHEAPFPVFRKAS